MCTDTSCELHYLTPRYPKTQGYKPTCMGEVEIPVNYSAWVFFRGIPGVWMSPVSQFTLLQKSHSIDYTALLPGHSWPNSSARRLLSLLPLSVQPNFMWTYSSCAKAAHCDTSYKHRAWLAPIGPHWSLRAPWALSTAGRFRSWEFSLALIPYELITSDMSCLFSPWFLTLGFNHLSL